MTRVLLTAVLLVAGLVGLLMSLCGGVTLFTLAHNSLAIVKTQWLLIYLAVGACGLGIIAMVACYRVVRSLWSRQD
ncbi:MAG TPA: hypothetical protein VMC02_00500 [Steroidobacteraceae bacterium]|nr:hypothetical protein [Steroidobacteraceae bacterium]